MPEHLEDQENGLGYPLSSRGSYVDGEVPPKARSQMVLMKKLRNKVHPGNRFLGLEI